MTALSAKGSGCAEWDATERDRSPIRGRMDGGIAVMKKKKAKKKKK